MGFREIGPAQFLPAIDPELPEIWIGEKTAPPLCIEEWAGIPAVRVGVAMVDRAESAIEIPVGTEGEFSAAGQVEESAETKDIDVAAEDFENMKVNPGIDIDVGTVSLIGIFPVGRAQDPLEFVEPALEILTLGSALGKFNDSFFRVDKYHGGAAGPEAIFAGAFTVEFEKVPACDCGRLEVIRPEAIDGDAMFANFDFFLEHVNAEIIALCDRAGVCGEEDFDKAGVRRPVPNLPAQLVNERIVNHDRVELVGRVEDPIGIWREAKGRKGKFVVEFIDEVDGEGGLGKTGRTGPALMNSGASGEGRLTFERGGAIDRFVEGEMSELRAW